MSFGLQIDLSFSTERCEEYFHIVERHSRDSCKLCLHFFGMPVTLDNLAIFPAQVSGCLRLQLQFDYNGSLEGREISTRRLHITRGPGLIPRLGGYDSVVAGGICSVARRV